MVMVQNYAGYPVSATATRHTTALHIRTTDDGQLKLIIHCCRFRRSEMSSYCFTWQVANSPTHAVYGMNEYKLTLKRDIIKGNLFSGTNNTFAKSHITANLFI